MELFFKNIQKIQFIGIGGVGISALAKMLLNKGYSISGINNVTSKKTLQQLYDKGVDIKIGNSPKLLDKTADLYVYSVAWHKLGPALLNKALKTGKAKSYFEALGFFSNQMNIIAVSGTHGKTTTTAMIHAILKQHNFNHETIVGSILNSEGSNYVPSIKKTNYLLVEACEYKRHFLNFCPELLVITNIEAEHLDYYKDLNDVQSAFLQLIKQTKGKKIILNFKDKNTKPLINKLKNFTVVDYYSFLNKVPLLKVPGDHNKQNAAAALATAKTLLKNKFSYSLAKKALSNFLGTWRRFELIGKTKRGTKVYSDYAHHPTELKATINTANKLCSPNNKIWVIFEPHTFSRVKELADEFSTSFLKAFKVYISPVYAAREAPIKGINNKFLAKKINAKSNNAICTDSVKNAFKDIEKLAKKGDFILGLGAGDIHNSLLSCLQNNK